MTYTGTLIRDLMSTANELVYASYAHNRRISPEVSPQRWAQIYKNAAEMETRFQSEALCSSSESMKA